MPVFCYIIVLSLLLSLSIYDYKYYILPNKLNAALALAFGAFHLSLGWSLITPVDALLGALAGSGLLLAIRAAANKYYDDDALGLGDVKLMAAAGIGLGFPNILLALSLGALLGLGHGLLMGWAEKRRGAKNINFSKINVPAGLGLCGGTAIVMAMQFGTGWIR